MQMPPIHLQTFDLDEVEFTDNPGASGSSRRRIRQFGDLTVRLVELSPGYLAEYWCDKGHVIHCMEGEVEIQLKDGRSFPLRAGMTCVVGDGVDEHRGYSAQGAKLFVVD